MHQYFADWYRVTGIDIAAVPLEARWQAIETLVAGLKAPSAIELVRLAHQRIDSQASFVTEMRDIFKATDATFPMRDNDFEMAVLAAVAEVHLLESEGTHPADLVALATESAAFSHWTPALPELPDAASSYVANEATRVRKHGEPPTLSGMSVSKEAAKPISDLASQNAAAPIQASMMEDLVKALDAALARAGKFLSKVQQYAADLHDIRAEEIDVLWWLLGEASIELGRPWAAIDPVAHSLVMGRELASRTIYLPGLRASAAILQRASRSSGPEGVDASVGEAINAAPYDWRQLIAREECPDKLPILMPIHVAIIKAVEVGEGGDWVPLAQHETKFDFTSRVTSLEMSRQMYTESLLLRAYKEAQ